MYFIVTYFLLIFNKKMLYIKISALFTVVSRHFLIFTSLIKTYLYDIC